MDEAFGPKVDCSRKRSATLAATTGFAATTDAEIPPEAAEPGLGFTTVTDTEPTCAAVAVPVAVSSPFEKYCVVSGIVPKFTVAPLMKLLPVSTMLNGPTAIGAPATLVSTGIGLSNVTALVPGVSVPTVTAALIVAVFGAGRTAGAVYKPVPSIVPLLRSLPQRRH